MTRHSIFTMASGLVALGLIACGGDPSSAQEPKEPGYEEPSTTVDAGVFPGADAGTEPTPDAAAPAVEGGKPSADAAPTPWSDPTLTTDPSARAKASAYEAQLWPYRDDLAFHIKDQFGTGRLSDAEAQKLTYSSGWGLAVYHTMDELVLLTHVMEATEDEQHRLWYAELAKEVLDISVPAIVEGRGTEACPKSASLYACSKGYFRYLDAGHGAGAAGFVMNAMYENPDLRAIYQQDLDGWAKALQPTLERHYAITESTAATKTPHMPAKIAAGYLAIGKILGEAKYLDAFEHVAKVLAASAETNTPAGWVGSDISHARVSAAVIHLAYREQLRGTLPVIVTPEHLAGIGDAFEAARQKYSANAGFVGSYVGDHGVFVVFSTGMAALVDPTYSFDNVTAGSHSFERPAETLAALAMGHATRVVPAGP